MSRNIPGTPEQCWQHILLNSARNLSDAGISDPRREARWLLAHALGIKPDRLTLILNEPVQSAPMARLDEYLARRCRHEPMSHILGRRAFFNHDFLVTPDVLDPRPETEVLVGAALQHRVKSMLDLGTGSGCIMLSVLAQCPDAVGIGTDLSQPALMVAQRNATRLGLTSRCEFRQSNWFENISGRFDLITCNPPYISAAEMAGLAPEVVRYEPKLALTPGGDGLAAYRAITAQAHGFLQPGGRLIVEIGPTQSDVVQTLFDAAQLDDIRTLCDLDGRDRVVIGRRNADNTG